MTLTTQSTGSAVEAARRLWLSSGKGDFLSAVAETLYRVVPYAQRGFASWADYQRRRMPEFPTQRPMGEYTFPILVEMASPLRSICAWAGIRLVQKESSVDQGDEKKSPQVVELPVAGPWLFCAPGTQTWHNSFLSFCQGLQSHQAPLTVVEGVLFHCHYPHFLKNAELLFSDPETPELIWRLHRAADGKDCLEEGPAAEIRDRIMIQTKYVFGGQVTIPPWLFVSLNAPLCIGVYLATELFFVHSTAIGRVA